MATAAIDERKLKNLLKSAFAEALEEQRALVQDIVEEAIEDIALARQLNRAWKAKPLRVMPCLKSLRANSENKVQGQLCQRPQKP